jgi:hypothetical protein
MNWRILALRLPLMLAGCEVEEGIQVHAYRSS